VLSVVHFFVKSSFVRIRSTNLLNQYQFQKNDTQFFSIYGHIQIGDETRFKGQTRTQREGDVKFNTILAHHD
jgi:hypothetical protein